MMIFQRPSSPAAIPNLHAAPLKGGVAAANVFGLLGLLAFASILQALMSGPLDGDAARGIALTVAVYLVACVLTLALWRRLRGANPQAPSHRRFANIQGWCVRAFQSTGSYATQRPLSTIWLAALLGVVLSCFPIIFLGKSFLGPAVAGALLYNHEPTLPGSTERRVEWSNGSDVAAGILQQLPYSAVERHAIFHDGEFPLWNRFNSGGVPLLGQGQSMLADPLHLPVLLGGNAWAWDCKFLAAKLLFAAGIGLTIRIATGGRLFAAALLAFGACFIGFFIFRFNHPAFFSECYAPWILYAWLRLGQIAPGVGSRRAVAGSLGLLLIAEWTELGSGAVKEAVFLMLVLNAAGALALTLSSRLTLRERLLRMALAGWTGVCFVLLSAPLWLTFLSALDSSWNLSVEPSATQLQPGMLVGLFDDIFYRQFSNYAQVVSPSTNFLVLLGLGLAVASWKRLARRGVFLALAISSVATGAFVFGVVPPWLIIEIPFLANVIHVETTLSCPLIILLIAVAGCGLQHAHDRVASRGWALNTWGAVGMMVFITALFLGMTQAIQDTEFPFAPLGTHSSRPPFFWEYIVAIAGAYTALPFLWRSLCRHRGANAPGVLPWVVICLGTLFWRQAFLDHAIDASTLYVQCPPARADYHVLSPTVERVRATQQTQPGRTIGFDGNLAPGFGGMYGLEQPSGPDALENRYFHKLVADSGLPMVYSWALCTFRQTFPGYHRFYDMLNVRYYLDRPPGEPEKPLPPGLRLIARDDLDLYVSDTAWPRAFFTDKILECNGDGGLFYILEHGDGRPFVTANRAELATQPGLQALSLHSATDRAIIPATDYRLTNNTTTFRVHSTGPGVVAVLEGFQPEDMRVSVNGAPAECFRVNEAFSGLYLASAGEYTVRLRYWPRSLTAALWMAALGAGLTGLTGFALWRKNMEPPAEAASLRVAPPPEV